MLAFMSSRAAVLELTARYKSLITELESAAGGNSASASVETASKSTGEHLAAGKLLFRQMVEVCLWGNAADLSLLINLNYSDIQKLPAVAARQTAERNILVNDTDAAFDILKTAQAAVDRNGTGDLERRVDIILDNAAFELFADLVLAGCLLAVGLATTVVLHSKSLPWFVSDVIPADLPGLLYMLTDPRGIDIKLLGDERRLASGGGGGGGDRELEALSAEDIAQLELPLSDEQIRQGEFMTQHWGRCITDGRLVIRPNRFWTEGGSYWRLPESAPELLEELKSSELVIFKGDLNYRKLTADVSSTSFLYLLMTKLTSRSRQCEPQQRPSLLTSALSALAPASGRSRCAPVRRTSLSACRKARTNAYGLRTEAAGTVVPVNGRGAGSGLLYSCVMGRRQRRTRRHE